MAYALQNMYYCKFDKYITSAAIIIIFGSVVNMAFLILSVMHKDYNWRFFLGCILLGLHIFIIISTHR